MARKGIVTVLQDLLKGPSAHLSRLRAALRDRTAEEERNEMTKTESPDHSAGPVAEAAPRQGAGGSLGATLPLFLPAILRIWSVQQRIEQGGDPERALAMVRWHINNALDDLTAAGFEFRSYEGQPYDPGMRAIVPKFREDPDVVGETVGKTEAPAVFYHGHLLAKSKAVVLAPPVSEPMEDTAEDGKEAGNPEAAGSQASERNSTEAGASTADEGRRDEAPAPGQGSQAAPAEAAAAEGGDAPKTEDQAESTEDDTADAENERREKGER